MKIKDYEEIGNSVELYYTFKDFFFDNINQYIAEWKESNLLKEYFLAYEFNSARILIDKQVSKYHKLLSSSIEEGVSDRVYNFAYRNWRHIENMFLSFEEKYSELLEEQMY